VTERVVYLRTAGGPWIIYPSATRADLAIVNVGEAPAAEVARLASRTLIAAPLAKHPHRIVFGLLGPGKFINLNKSSSQKQSDDPAAKGMKFPQGAGLASVIKKAAPSQEAANCCGLSGGQPLHAMRCSKCAIIQQSWMLDGARCQGCRPFSLCFAVIPTLTVTAQWVLLAV
jgi:hypothetical protein